ncbi:MAG: hypothetical protein WC797_00610 [Candidatus Paceibacterota bacterium]|jgi:hypothetical protein
MKDRVVVRKEDPCRYMDAADRSAYEFAELVSRRTGKKVAMQMVKNQFADVAAMIFDKLGSNDAAKLVISFDSALYSMRFLEAERRLPVEAIKLLATDVANSYPFFAPKFLGSMVKSFDESVLSQLTPEVAELVDMSRHARPSDVFDMLLDLSRAGKSVAPALLPALASYIAREPDLCPKAVRHLGKNWPVDALVVLANGVKEVAGSRGVFRSELKKVFGMTDEFPEIKSVFASADKADAAVLEQRRAMTRKYERALAAKKAGKNIPVVEDTTEEDVASPSK